MLIVDKLNEGFDPSVYIYPQIDDQEQNPRKLDAHFKVEKLIDANGPTALIKNEIYPSYMTVDEAIRVRDALAEAIKLAAKLSRKFNVGDTVKIKPDANFDPEIDGLLVEIRENGTSGRIVMYDDREGEQYPIHADFDGRILCFTQDEIVLVSKAAK